MKIFFRKGCRFNITKSTPYLFILPVLVLFLTFNIFPVFYAFGLSFTRFELGKIDFIGLTNYINLFLRDKSFLKALINTCYLWLINVPLMTFTALIFAVLLNTKLKLRSVFRLVYFIPVVFSMLVSGLSFLYMFDPQGLVSLILGKFNIIIPNILVMPDFAIPLISSIVLWHWFGYNVVIMLGGLQTIPKEVIEASIVDGANNWQRFWNIIVPILKPIIVFVFMMSTIGAFNIFDEAFALYGPTGGPEEGGLLLANLIYRNAFVYYRISYGITIAFIVAVIIFILTFLLYKYSKTEY